MHGTTNIKFNDVMVPKMLLILNIFNSFRKFISSRTSEKKTRLILFSVYIHKVRHCIPDQFDSNLCLNVVRTRNNRPGKYTTRGLTTIKTGTNLLRRLEQKQSAGECRSKQLRLVFLQFHVTVHHTMINQNTSLLQQLSIYFT